jgi:nucleoside-diphosphate-sugar epimerase
VLERRLAMTRPRLLVTGASGFIGSHVVDLALERGYALRNLDLQLPQWTEHRPHWVSVDVRDARAVIANVEEFCPTHVLHMASDVDVSLRTLADYATITEGTRNVLAAIEGRQLERFVHISTQFVLTPGLAPKDEHDLRPYTVYGAAKAEAERMVWAARLDMPWLILRPTLVWGPGHPSFANAIWKYIANRRYFHPAGQHTVRCYGYVRNTASQIVSFVDAASLPADKRVYYLGDGDLDYAMWANAFAVPLTGRPTRSAPAGVLRVAALAGDLFGRIGLPSPYDSGRHFRMTTPSPVDLSDTFGVIGRHEMVSFDEGVRSTLEWLKRVDPILFAGVSSG